MSASSVAGTGTPSTIVGVTATPMLPAVEVLPLDDAQPVAVDLGVHAFDVTVDFVAHLEQRAVTGVGEAGNVVVLRPRRGDQRIHLHVLEAFAEPRHVIEMHAVEMGFLNEIVPLK